MLPKSALVRILVAGVAIGGCAAPGCQPIQYEWQGPSSGFRGVDYNSDGAIDQVEREWVTGSYRDLLDDFRVYDCDRDGRITWHEHFEYRFKNRICPGTTMVLEKAVPAAVQHLSPLLTMPNDVVSRSGTMLTIRRSIGFFPPRLSRGYSEADPRPDQRGAVTLTEGVLESARLAAAGDMEAQYQESSADAAESVKRLRCRVANGSNDFLVRLVDLDIQWTNEGADAVPLKRGYLKTLVLSPGSATDLLAWFPTEVREASCMLRDVRGQPAG